MKPPYLASPRVLSLLAVGVAICEVLIDWITPISVNISIIYSIPLVLAGLSRRRKLLWSLTVVLLCMTFIVYVAQTGHHSFSVRTHTFRDRELAAATITLTATLLHLWTRALDAVDQRDAEHRERDPKVVAEDGGDIREADDVYDGIAQCAHGIRSRLEEVCGVADGVAGNGNVERLAAAVHQDPIAQRKPLREHEEAVVGAAVDDDVATAPDRADRRPETLERRYLGVRKESLVGEIGAQVREKCELFEIRDRHRPLLPRLATARHPL